MNFDIDNLATLARLELSDEEREALRTQLPSIVEYIGKLQEVDMSSVDAKAYLTDAKNVFRDDAVEPSSAEVKQAIFDNFPKKTGQALEVPGVFE